MATRISAESREALTSWRSLIKDINNFNLKDLNAMLKWEEENCKRQTVINKIKARIMGLTMSTLKRDLKNG